MLQRGELKKMTQDDLNQIMDQQKDGIAINLKDADLSGLDLSGRTIEAINFEDCNLNNVNFSRTTIKKGEFKNGLLIGGNFEKADLSGVNFNGCAMQKVNLSHVRIEGVGIKGSNLANASLKRASVEFSNLNVFKDVNLTDADFSGSNISWLYGENINFKNANFNAASILESQIKDCSFVNASLENAELYSVVFLDCEMQESTLAKAKITNVTFDKSMLENADFQQSEIGYGNFVDSNLDGVDFRGVTLSSSNEFRNVSLVAADFSEVSFSEESKLYDVDVAELKGLDPANLASFVTAEQPAVSELQLEDDEFVMKEYEYYLNLFIAKNVGSQINAEVDGKIAQTLLERGYSSQSITAAIVSQSPNAPQHSSKVGLYAMNVVKKALRASKAR